MTTDYNRPLLIVVWGNEMRSRVPSSYKIQRNFSVTRLNNVISNKDGTSEQVQRQVTSHRSFWKRLDEIIDTIEDQDLTRISINCKLGFHRSVVTAIKLQEKYYPQAKIVFLEI